MTNDYQIREHLEAVLASPEFTTAPRLQQFLRFVVHKSLNGEAHEIKEYVVATDVYGRGPEYDPQVDSTVRVEASRLRSRLRAYYERHGAQAPVRIVLPKGTYVPVVERQALAN